MVSPHMVLLDMKMTKMCSGTFNHGTQLSDSSLEAEEQNTTGKEKTEFLCFIRSMLQWRPEDRMSARELTKDPWLRQQ